MIVQAGERSARSVNEPELTPPSLAQSTLPTPTPELALPTLAIHPLAPLLYQRLDQQPGQELLPPTLVALLELPPPPLRGCETSTRPSATTTRMRTTTLRRTILIMREDQVSTTEEQPARSLSLS